MNAIATTQEPPRMIAVVVIVAVLAALAVLFALGLGLGLGVASQPVKVDAGPG